MVRRARRNVGRARLGCFPPVVGFWLSERAKVFPIAVSLCVCMDESYYIDLNQVPNWARKTTITETEGDIEGLECDGCGHQWKPRVDQPKTCPQCNANILWDESETDEAFVVNQADVAELSQPTMCDECGEPVDTDGDDEQASTESDDNSKTLGDLLGDGDE